jgi:5'-3' exonuclease
MGIKHLNQFLRDNCSKKSIQHVHLKTLANKTIVVDTYIYMYKFISDNALLENMYLFISAFKEYNITPIFVFDGKPPPEKKALLNRRYLEKKEAENKYTEIQKLLSPDSLSELTEQQKADALKDMDLLKKQFIRVREGDVKQVKSLMESFGMSYYDAPGEADEVCAKLSLSGKAWGCLSDDMDMFLYGCPFVLRGFNLLKHSVIVYDTESILNDLEMSSDDFREILVISGTDYNIYSGTNLHETIKWFNEYNKYRHNKNKYVGFYVWLLKNTKYIRDYRELIQTYLLFKLPINKDDPYDISYNKHDMNIDDIRNIMEKEGFVFIKPLVS